MFLLSIYTSKKILHFLHAYNKLYIYVKFLLFTWKGPKFGWNIVF